MIKNAAQAHQLFQLNTRKNDEMIHKWCLANTDDPDAQIMLGILHLYGRGVTRNYSIAQNLFQKYPDALYSMTFMIRLKRLQDSRFDLSIVPTMLLGAIRKQRDLYALMDLAQLYEHGLYYKRNLKKAVMLIKVASKLGHVPATVKLAQLYKDRDLQKALDLNQELIEKGCSDGYLNMGNLKAYYYVESEDVDGERLMSIQNDYEEVCKMGNSSALYEFATILMGGTGFVQQDVDKARKYLDLAVKYGSIEAVKGLGALFELNEDFDGARNLYKDAIAKYNAIGYLCLGNLEKSLGNNYEARIHFLNGIKANVYECNFELAMIALSSGDFDAAERHLMEMVDKSPNFEEIGEVYFQLGLICKERGDLKNQKDYMSEAASHDHAESQIVLASLVESQKSKKKYLDRALELECHELLLNYAEQYEIDLDFENAFSVWSILSESDDIQSLAMFKLGCFYENGTGVKQDLKKSLDCYLKSQEPLAFNNIGEFYLKGKGVKQNIKRAKEYFEKSIAAGEDSGWTLLNLVLLLNHFGNQAPSKMTKELVLKIQATLSLDRDDPDAQFMLARCYLEGIQCDIDFRKAEILLEKCKDQVPDALEHLEYIRNEK